MKKTRPRQAAKAKAQGKRRAVANWRAIFGLAAIVIPGFAIFILCLSAVHLTFPQDLVKSQVVRVKSAHPPGKSTPGTAGIAFGQTSTNYSPGLRGQPVQAGYEPIGFDTLSGFPFLVTDQMVNSSKDQASASLRTMEQIPPQVKAFNERKVSLRGFMLPVKLNGNLVSDFLLLRNQTMCCYGVPPKITEWVNVHMAGKGINLIMDQPVTICGTFHVGEVREQGQLLGIYSLDGEKTAAPGD